MPKQQFALDSKYQQPSKFKPSQNTRWVVIDAPPLIKPTAVQSKSKKDTRMALLMQRMKETTPKHGLDMSEYEPVLQEPKRLFVLKRANIKLLKPKLQEKPRILKLKRIISPSPPAVARRRE